MKKQYILVIGLVLILSGIFATNTFAAPFSVGVGGTGTTTPSGILYGTNSSSNPLQTVTIGTGCTFSGGTLNCPGTGGTFGQTWEISGGFLSPTTTIPIKITATATSTFNGPVYVSNTGSLTGIPSYLRIGSTTPAGGYFTNNLLDAVDSVNDFVAIDTNNNANGTCATADFAAVNDVGTLTMNFGDFGHTSSLFTGSGCVNNPFTGFGANSSYIFDPNGNMNFAIASTSDASFRFFTAGYGIANEKMRLTNTGRLGIGTTSPASTFEVHGNLSIDNLGGPYTFSYIGEPSFNGTVLATTDPTDVFVVATTSKNAKRALAVTAVLDGSTGGNVATQGFNATAIASSTVTGNLTGTGTGGNLRNRLGTMNGLNGLNVNTQSAVSAFCQLVGSLGSTTNCIDYNAESTTIPSGGLVTNNFHFLAKTDTITGTLTNNYGYYSEALTGGTNRYAFYNAGTSDLNYFAGSVGIGTTSPFANLSINGLSGGTTNLFAIATSSASATSTAFIINSAGNVSLTGGSNLTLAALGVPAGSFIAVDPTGKVIATTTPSGGSGTVTSVAASVPSFLSISGSPVTTSGTLAISYSGTALPVANGGTGQTTFTASQLLYGNGMGAFSSVGTTTPTFGLGLTGSNITTISNSAGASSFSIATSSLYTGTTGQFPYFSGTNTITATSSIFIGADGKLGIGTTTPFSQLSVSTTAQQAGTLRLFTVASTTQASLFTVFGNGLTGVGTTTPGTLFSIGNTTGWNFTDGATTTSKAFGINLTGGGCFSINNVCVGASSGPTGSGATGQATFWTGASTVSGSNNFFWDNTNMRLGVGTTSPFATLSIHALSNSPLSNYLFAVASSTPTATTTAFAIDRNNHIIVNGGLPTLSGFGVGGGTLSAGSNDNAGHITTGAAATSGTVTFKIPYTTAPYCFVNDANNALATAGIPTQTSFSINYSSAINADLFYYCISPAP